MTVTADVSLHEGNTMGIAGKFLKFLERHQVEFQEFPHVPVFTYNEIFEHLDFPRANLIVGTPLIDSRGPMMAIHSFQAKPDLELINQKLGRRFQQLSDEQIRRVMSDCDKNSTPPFGNAYGLPIIVDRDVPDLVDFFFRGGKCDSLLHVNQANFQRLVQGANLLSFCVPLNEDGLPDTTRKPKTLVRDLKGLSIDEVAHRLSKVYNMPPMPAMALRILQLTSNPNSHVSELALTIEQDPPLAAQIMRYARSAIFNFQGEINSVQDAVNIVLGFDRVASIAMGIASLRAFSIPNDGPWGLSSVWRHALYCSYLAQQLAQKIPGEKGINPGTAYLCGLLHNIGILLVGQLFRPEYQEINALIRKHPETPVSLLEQQVFGAGWDDDVMALGHGTFGAILLKQWNLPEPVVKSAGLHQKRVYKGQDQHYVALIRLTNSILHENGIGEYEGPVDQDELFAFLGINPDLGSDLAEQALEGRDELDMLAACMVA